MQKELDALEQNKTWVLTDLPPRKRVITSKWLYRVKYKQDMTIDKYKTRLIAKRYNQLAGIDYHDNFSSVAKLVTVRLFLVLAAKFQWLIH